MAQRPKRALAGIVLVVINVEMYMKIGINYLQSGTYILKLVYTSLLQLISYYIHVYIKATINIYRSKPEHLLNQFNYINYHDYMNLQNFGIDLNFRFCNMMDYNNLKKKIHLGFGVFRVKHKIHY